MIVQKYYMEENKDLIHDEEQLEEWNELANKLGVTSETKGKTKALPIPFEPLTQNIENVISELCPSSCDYKLYRDGTIPLEVLRVIDLAEKEEYFCEIKIYYDRETPDPFLIGDAGHWYEMDFYDDSKHSIKDKKFKTKKEVEENGGKHPAIMTITRFLMAKWGDVEKSFDELKRMAYEKNISKTKAECENSILDLQNKIAKCENEAKLDFGIL